MIKKKQGLHFSVCTAVENNASLIVTLKFKKKEEDKSVCSTMSADSAEVFMLI